MDLMEISTKEKDCVINIYAPNHYKEKGQCWDTIKEALKETQTGKIILGGDLNLVRSIEEKFGGTYHTDPSRDASTVPLTYGSYCVLC